jgi:DHA1 family bicyclomycin/chloramphenicol resistance-like MFS transporter
MRHSFSFVFTLGFLTGVAALSVDMSLPAVPALAAAFGAPINQAQGIVGVFMAGLACGQIPAGLLSDRFGRLPVLYIGIALFSIAAVVVTLANSIELVLAGRFAQGFLAASGIVVTRAIVRDVATGQEAAKLMSVMTMVFTAMPVLAPGVGAIVIALFGWRAPFATIAILAFFMLASIRLFLRETHQPNSDSHPVAQLKASFAEFFSHRQSIFGLLIFVFAPAGFMSLITVSSALVTDVYDFSLGAFGLIFALAGLSVLAGSFLSRILVSRFTPLEMIRFAVVSMSVAGIQLLVMVIANDAPFIWLWFAVCLFLGNVGLLMPNATVIALDPLPRIAGVASSILGTLSNVAGASGALLAARSYDGTVRGALLMMTVVTGLIVCVYLLKPWICPKIKIVRPGVA